MEAELELLVTYLEGDSEPTAVEVVRRALELIRELKDVCVIAISVIDDDEFYREMKAVLEKAK